MSRIIERFGISNEMVYSYIDWFLTKGINGSVTLVDMLQEECAELIQSCSKWKRSDPMAKAMLTEEIAHVLHLSAAVAKFVGIDREEIDAEIQKKADKYGWLPQHPGDYKGVHEVVVPMDPESQPSVEELMDFIKRPDVAVDDWSWAANELYNRTELSMADIYAIAGKSFGISGKELSDRLMRYSNVKNLDERIHNLNAKMFDGKNKIREKIPPIMVEDCLCCEFAMNLGKVSEDEKTAQTVAEIWDKAFADGLYDKYFGYTRKGRQDNGDQS